MRQKGHVISIVTWWCEVGGQISILFMDMIVTFLLHLSLLKSDNLWIMLIVPEPAYINEEAGPLIC